VEVALDPAPDTAILAQVLAEVVAGYERLLDAS